MRQESMPLCQFGRMQSDIEALSKANWLLIRERKRVTKRMALKKLKHADLVNRHVELHGGTKKVASAEIAKAFETVENLLAEGVQEGVRVPIRNFGVFTAKMSKERTQQNHLAGGEITIPSTPSVSFKKSKSIKL